MKNLEIICKKSPSILKHFKELQEKDKLFDINIVEEIMDIYTKEKNILKNMKFNILEYDKIEKIYDAINEKVRYGKINTFLNNETSLKSRGQINKETFDLLNQIMLSNISLDELSEIVFNKINVFKTKNSLNEAIQKFIKSKMDNNVRLIYENAKNLNVNLLKINENDNILILKINDFNTSRILGSVSWCISRSETYWHNYVTGGNRYSFTKKEKLIKSLGIRNERNQIFIWDLNNKNEMETMIGLTYDKDYKKCYTAHLKNDMQTNIRLKKYLKIDEILKNKKEPDEIDEILKVLNNINKNKVSIKKYINDFFDINEYEEEYIKRYIELKKENKYEIIENMNSVLLKRYNRILIPEKNTIIIDEWIKQLQNANEIFPEKMIGLLKASKLLDMDIIIKNEKNFIEKINTYSEIIDSINNDDAVIFKKDYLFKKIVNNLKIIKINNDEERLVIKKYLNKDIFNNFNKKSNLFIISNFNTQENISFIKSFVDNGLNFEYFKDNFFLQFLSNEKYNIHEEYFFSVMKNIKMEKKIFELFDNNNDNINKNLKNKLLYKMLNESSKENIKKFLLINKNDEKINSILSGIKISDVSNMNECSKNLIIEIKLKNKIMDILNGDEKFLKEIKEYKKLYVPIIKEKYPGILKINSILNERNSLSKKI